jgi:hypothetical protein
MEGGKRVLSTRMFQLTTVAVMHFGKGINQLKRVKTTQSNAPQTMLAGSVVCGNQILPAMVYRHEDMYGHY